MTNREFRDVENESTCYKNENCSKTDKLRVVSLSAV